MEGKTVFSAPLGIPLEFHPPKIRGQTQEIFTGREQGPQQRGCSIFWVSSTAAQQINCCFEDQTVGKFRATFSPRPCRERFCHSWEEDKGTLLPYSFSPARAEDTGISQGPWEGVQVPLFKNKVLSRGRGKNKKKKEQNHKQTNKN